MKKSTKVLIVLLVFFGLFSLAAKYYKFAIAEDYFISAAIECDVEAESCFVWDCDMEEDEDCDHTPYKYIYIHAHEAPDCASDALLACELYECPETSDSCEITECSEDVLAEDEFCFVTS